MLNQPRNPQGFGVDKSRIRAADIHTCVGCERHFKRVIDAKGKRVRSPALLARS